VFSIVSDESAYVNFYKFPRSHHSLTYHGDKEKLEETDEELLELIVELRERFSVIRGHRSQS
jgi:hypothetical protein